MLLGEGSSHTPLLHVGRPQLGVGLLCCLRWSNVHLLRENFFGFLVLQVLLDLVSQGGHFELLAQSYHELEGLVEVDLVHEREHLLVLVVDDAETDSVQAVLVDVFLLLGQLTSVRNALAQTMFVIVL